MTRPTPNSPNPTLPPRFVERYEVLVAPEQRAALMEAAIAPLKPSLRVNTLKCSVKQFKIIAAKNNWVLTPVPWCTEGFYYEAEQSLAKSVEFFAGLFYIQEAASMIPPLVLAPQPDEIVLDLSAAPGSKTTQIAAMMQNKGLLLANDKDLRRISSLVFNLEKYGVLNSLITTYDAKELGNLQPECADKVLLDAPCSAEGSARKDTDYFTHWREEKIAGIANVQRSLLFSALKLCRVGGNIVYSTCTLAPEENEGNLQWLLENYGEHVQLETVKLNTPFSPGLADYDGINYDATISRSLRILPHQADVEAFFVARLTKTSYLPQKNLREAKTFYSNEKLLPVKRNEEILTQLSTKFGLALELFDGLAITELNDRLWLKPIHALNRFPKLKIDRSGVPLGRRIGNDVKISYPFSIAFGHHATVNVINIDDAQTEDYIHGTDIHLTPEQISSDISPGQVILKNKEAVLGRGLFQFPEKIKNQVDKAFVVR